MRGFFEVGEFPHFLATAFKGHWKCEQAQIRTRASYLRRERNPTLFMVYGLTNKLHWSSSDKFGILKQIA
jgi:hypothetical protein